MNYIMILPLLLMGTSVILGHSIKKLDINNETEADVYEIKEDSATNTVVFVNPKVEKSTLREIVYYHMIERPYGPNDGRVRYETEEGPEIDETVRPFTNSHGFPFLESVDKELDIETKNDLNEDFPEEKEVVIEYIPKEDEVYDEISYYDEEFPVDVKITKQEESKEIPTTVASEIVKEISTEAKMEETAETVTEKSKLEVDVLETSSNPETTTAHLIEETTQAVTVTESPITTSVTEEPVFEKKAKTARKLLFDRVKERYYSKPNETQNTTSTAERRKREVNMHIPEAPKLGELNYDSLPPYLRRLISTEKPKARINSDSESDEEERLDDIKHRMHKLISTLKTADTHEEKPRTYGMNLTADSGYIWNDMTEPRIHYQVEASESIEEGIMETDGTVKPKSLSHDQNKHDERSNEHKSHEEKHKENRNNRRHHDDDQEGTSESMEDRKNSSEEKGRKSNKHKENDDMNQLMENDQFWKWLADWTSVYMDVLADHIEEAVHQEVIDQIKVHTKEHHKDSKVPVEEQDIPEDHDKEHILDKSEDKDTDKHDEKTTPEPVADNVTEEKKSGSDKKDIDEEDLLKKRKDKEHKKKENENREEAITNNTKEESKPKETAKIEAQNVYGNTIGGDKVTNIFIFYPNQDANKVIQDISKLNNSNNVQIDVRLNVPDDNKKEDIPHKDASTHAPIENNTKVPNEITTEIPKESSKTTKSPEDIEEKLKDKAILVVPTTNAQEPTTTEQTDLIKTMENKPEIESTTEPGKHEDLPKKIIEDNTKEPKHDENKEKEVVEKSVETEKEQNEKHETTKTDNEEPTEKYKTKDESKEEIVSSTIINEPEISTEPSI